MTWREVWMRGGGGMVGQYGGKNGNGSWNGSEAG